MTGFDVVPHLGAVDGERSAGGLPATDHSLGQHVGNGQQGHVQSAESGLLGR